MLREPRRIEPFHAPPEFLCAGPDTTRVDLPLGGQVAPVLLRRFAHRMAERGMAVQLARMGYDRVYACECLARAHAGDDATLRDWALRLFEAFGRRG